MSRTIVRDHGITTIKIVIPPQVKHHARNVVALERVNCFRNVTASSVDRCLLVSTTPTPKPRMDEKPFDLQRYSTVAMLPDGIYDAIVIESERLEDGDIRIELAITLGAHIGRVIALHGRHVDAKKRSRALERDPFELLGIPGTLIIRDGVPTFRPEL